MQFVLEAIDVEGEQILARLDDRVDRLNGELLIARSGPRSRTYTSMIGEQAAAVIDEELRDIAPGWEAHLSRQAPRWPAGVLA